MAPPRQSENSTSDEHGSERRRVKQQTAAVVHVVASHSSRDTVCFFTLTGGAQQIKQPITLADNR